MERKCDFGAHFRATPGGIYPLATPLTASDEYQYEDTEDNITLPRFFSIVLHAMRRNPSFIKRVGGMLPRKRGIFLIKCLEKNSMKI